MLSTSLLYLAILAAKGVLVSSANIPYTPVLQLGQLIEEYIQPGATIEEYVQPEVGHDSEPSSVDGFYSPLTIYEVRLLPRYDTPN